MRNSRKLSCFVKCCIKEDRGSESSFLFEAEPQKTQMLSQSDLLHCSQCHCRIGRGEKPEEIDTCICQKEMFDCVLCADVDILFLLKPGQQKCILVVKLKHSKMLVKN